MAAGCEGKRAVMLAMLWALIGGRVLGAQELKGEVSVPTGFKIENYAAVPTARGMAFADDGTLFVGSQNGRVYAVTPNRKVHVVAAGLSRPVGVSVDGLDVYVSSMWRILKLPGLVGAVADPPQLVVVNDSFPRDTHHGWKFLGIGPDGLLYVPVGAPCNVCERDDPRYASIMRMNLDGTGAEIIAHGVRNTVGFDWHPLTGELWFTDNGRDWLGDDVPPDELNRLTVPGTHFGFPYLHGTDRVDPLYGSRDGALDFVPPVVELPAHVAALGMRFGSALEFPDRYRSGIFIAEHGSWNRSRKTGYRVSFVPLDGSSPLGYEVFAWGWLQGESSWGRPADVAAGPDGALYVSDDLAGLIYRIWYSPEG